MRMRLVSTGGDGDVDGASRVLGIKIDWQEGCGRDEGHIFVYSHTPT